IYLPIALILILVTGTLSPELALGIGAGLGLIGLVVAALRGDFGLHELRWVVIAMAIAAVTVTLARIWHLTRLTPDSLRYLLAANDLVLPEALEEMHKADLLIRQIGLPSLHAFSDLVDRRYVASIAPLFGVAGLGFFSWLAWHLTSRIDRARRWWLVGGAVAFLGTSNRLVYDAFYVNTHIQMAVYLLIGIAGSWLAVREEKPGWAFPAGLSLAASLLLRPEAPLVVAVVLVTVAASRAPRSARALITVPSVVAMTIWYGIVLWQNANFGSLISLTAPVFGSLLAVFGAALLVVIGGSTRARPLMQHFDLIGLAGLAILLVGYAISQPEIVVRSLEATFRNLTYDGLWLVTWMAALVLLVVALIVHRIPDGRMWTIPIVGFGLLFWPLPLIREGAWRVGAGDSGNRILAHILAVVVAFLILTAVAPRPKEKQPVAVARE
ncbi:MAG: hypothetical protein ACRDZM_17690, partial [Acidimicrobiia bacterium]